MIDLDITVSGGQLGGKLAQDPEEAAYAFIALLWEVDDSFPEDVADYLGANVEDVAQFFEMMAKRIRERDQS